jgi:hypothetical protein
MPVTTASNFARTRASLRFADTLTTGSVFFVDSVTGSATGGYTADAPAATIAQALALCTANAGDIIYLFPTHVESVAAAGLAWNKAGVSIIGIGNGNGRATITWTTTDAVVTVSGANTLVQNIITKTSIDECVSMFNVTGAGVTFDKVDFQETSAAQAIQWLITTAAADQLTIKNCYHVQYTAAASAQKWIQLVGTDHTRIVDNTFLFTARADTASHLISGSTAVVACEISRNNILWLGATITIVVNLVTTSTGIICDNRASSGTSVTTAAAFTADAAYMHNNLWSDTVQVSGLLAPVVDTDT